MRLMTVVIFIVTLLTLHQPVFSAETITVMTHDSFNISKAVMERFEKETGINVKFLKSGDAGAALIQAILSRKNPLADVFYGVDNTFFSRAVDADLFIPYNSPKLKNIPDDLKLDPGNRLLPVDFGDVCLNYDKKWFAEKKTAPPANLADLLKPAFKGLTVVENPAISSPGLAFLLATIGRFGEDGYLDFWKRLRENDVLIAGGWEDAYYGHFSAAKGDRPIVVSYASSPPAEVFFSKKPLTEAPTAAVVSHGSAFRQIEFVGILKGTKKPDAARRLVDYMLDVPFQEDIPLNMFVFPANRLAGLPPVFEKYAEISKNPVTVSPSEIEKNREKWINAWTNTALR